MLRRLLPDAQPLSDWLESATSAASGKSPSQFSLPGDSEDYESLLQDTLVASSPDPRCSRGLQPPITSLRQLSTMHDLRDRVIKHLVNSAGTASDRQFLDSSGGGGAASNVFALGYRRARIHAPCQMLGVEGIECVCPNTLHNIFAEQSWKTLLSRVGDDVMFRLLRWHMVLLRLPNRCYVQVAGPALPDLARVVRSLEPPVRKATTQHAGRNAAAPAGAVLPPPAAAVAAAAATAAAAAAAAAAASVAAAAVGVVVDKAAAPAIATVAKAQEIGAAPQQAASGKARALEVRRGGSARGAVAPDGVEWLPRHLIFYHMSRVRKAGLAPSSVVPRLSQVTAERGDDLAVAARLVRHIFAPASAGQGSGGGCGGSSSAGASVKRRKLGRRLAGGVPAFAALLKR
ncbi:unnamed protein product, partial [Phaeothamnion confervicola]